ncbi:hypothetical protein DVH24_028839 [Malus domestica]|uniref:Uncharacterized protein n=1 Tax=Malus domestica TaxID=3750 RepID=A0A498IVF8_MALDO|nr:hypothetical protein DVH24_028839 [Malus domestica]
MAIMLWVLMRHGIGFESFDLMREIRSIHGEREVSISGNGGVAILGLSYATLEPLCAQGLVTLRFLGLLCEAFEALCAQAWVLFSCSLLLTKTGLFSFGNAANGQITSECSATPLLSNFMDSSMCYLHNYYVCCLLLWRIFFKFMYIFYIKIHVCDMNGYDETSNGWDDYLRYEKWETMSEYIKRLKLCIKWFQELEESYLLEREKLENDSGIMQEWKGLGDK